MFREVITALWCEQRRVNREYDLWAIKDGQDLIEIRLEGISDVDQKSGNFSCKK